MKLTERLALEQQADAWQNVCETLNRFAPGWIDDERFDAGELAVRTIERLAGKHTPTPKPFDLEAAKLGKPLVTRDGRPARFVAHVPEATPAYQVVAFIEGNPQVTSHFIDGKMHDRFNSAGDLLMAPDTETVWVNIYQTYHTGDKAPIANAHTSKYQAMRAATRVGLKAVAIAVPVQIQS